MFIPFRQYSTFSLLKAIGQPEDIISSFANYQYPAASLTELNNVFSAVKLFSACKSNKIRPILGTDLKIKDSQGKRYNILCHAKNLNGWKGILKAISKASEPDYEEGITLEMAAEFFNGNVLVSTGSLYSELGLNVFTEYEKHLCGISYDQSKALVNPDWKKNTLLLFNSYKELFGKENVIAEICLSEKDYIPATEIISKIVKSLLKEIGCKAIYTTNSHYTNKQDAEIHRILLSSSLKTTLVDFESEAKKTGNYNLLPFYKTSKAYVLSPDEIKALYNETELKSNFEVLDLIEKFDILSNPQLPPYPIPTDSKSKDSNAYLRELCLKGWNEKIKKVIPEKDHGRYADRVKYELGVISEANLSDYFLIVQDIMNWARARFLCGPARGCFLPDTRVKLSDETYTPISMIKIGDEVIDAYGDKQKVYDVLEYDIDEEIIEIEFDNGKIIRCTKDHKFLTKNRGWVEAQFLTEEDDIVEV